MTATHLLTKYKVLESIHLLLLLADPLAGKLVGAVGPQAEIRPRICLLRTTRL